MKESETAQIRHQILPQTPIVKLLYELSGKKISYESRYYLADTPIHCGDLLEVFLDGKWRTARFEWSGEVKENPLLILPDDKPISLQNETPLRWPGKTSFA